MFFSKKAKLSTRELEILDLISKGCSNSEIAGELYISQYTVETHRKNMIRKMGKRNICEVLRYAFTAGLLI